MKITTIIGHPLQYIKAGGEGGALDSYEWKNVREAIKNTYAKDSKAMNRQPLYSCYIQAIRWATDRIDSQGIVAYLLNSNILSCLAFDGLRAHLHKDFKTIYIIDLGGSWFRHSRKRMDKPISNVLGIMTGLCICFFVKNNNLDMSIRMREGNSVYYHAIDDTQPVEKILKEIKALNIENIPWKKLFIGNSLFIPSC